MQAPKVNPSHTQTNHVNIAPAPSLHCIYAPDLEQSGQHNTNQARPETEISKWATLLNTLMRQADTAAHKGRGVGVTAHYHNFILSLPAQPLTVMLKETDAHTLHAEKKTCTGTHTKTQHTVKANASTSLLIVSHCQVAGWVLSIVLTEISTLATTNSGNVSFSI